MPVHVEQTAPRSLTGPGQVGPGGCWMLVPRRSWSLIHSGKSVDRNLGTFLYSSGSQGEGVVQRYRSGDEDKV